MDIAKKQNFQTVTKSFVKFLEKLIFKISNKYFVDPITNNSISHFHCPFRIFKNTIVGLDLALDVYLYNNNQTVITSIKKFLLKILNR